MIELRKSLTVWRGTALMLNIVIGAGLLILPGLAIKQVGAYALPAWLLCATATFPVLLVFVILGRRYPDAGGIPHFAARAFGPLAYSIGSFILLGAVSIGLPSIALTGGYYGASAFGGSPHVYAVGLILLALVFDLLSVEVSGRLNQIMAFVLLAFLCVLAAISLVLIEPAASPTSPFPALAEFDFGLLLAPFTMIFFAFTGWEIAANLSEEFRNPRRDFAMAMLMSFAIAVGLYMVMAYVIQTRELQGSYEASFAGLFGQRFGPAGAIAVGVIALVLIQVNFAATLWGASRLVFSLAREGVLFEPLTRLRGGQPYAALVAMVVIVLMVIGLDASGLVGVETLLGLSGQNFFLLYGLAAATLLRLGSGAAEKLLGLVSLVEVAGISLLQGGALIYPALLTVLAVVMSLRQRRAGDPPSAPEVGSSPAPSP